MSGVLGQGIAGSKNGLTIRIRQDSRALQALERRIGDMTKKVQDLRPIWPIIRDDFLKRMETLYLRRSGNVAGMGPWAPLNPDYAKLKRKMGYSPLTMVKTGNLLNSLTIEAHPDFVYKPTKKQLVIGTSTPYAQFHTTPAKNRDGSQRPAREPVRISREQHRFWIKTVKEYVLTQQDDRIS